jgi:DNA polymerase-3 subunit epsilon
MSLDFAAIDFETANSYRGSACSVGMVRIRDGAIAEKESFLIRHDESLGGFGFHNIQVHGITPQMIDAADAPEWEEALDRIITFIGSDSVVAHNAGFDSSVIRSATELAGLEQPHMSFHCSVNLSRRKYPDSPNHKLNTMAAYLGLGDFKHHDAADDSLISAMICIETAKRFGFDNFEEMMRRNGFQPSLLGKGRELALKRGLISLP